MQFGCNGSLPEKKGSDVVCTLCSKEVAITAINSHIYIKDQRLREGWEWKRSTETSIKHGSALLNFLWPIQSQAARKVTRAARKWW